MTKEARSLDARSPRPSASAVREPWHALECEAAVAALSASASDGLARAQVAERAQRFGPNALPEQARRSLLAVLLHQFRSPLIYLLLGVGVLALALGEISDAVVILVVVLVNAVIGAFQEGRAERSLEALRKLTRLQARVVREGREELVDARELVPGDVLLLAAGDAVAADVRLIEGAALQAAEAALTGESLPVEKEPPPLALDTLLADRRNMLYAGTHVAAGRGRALVVAIGLDTEIGRIASLAAAAVEPPTPLERRIRKFGHYVIGAAISMFLLVLGVGVLRGIPFGEILMVGISQVVGMIPEGLPVAMTVALAVGVQRMARRRAIVRRLSAVETLGSTTVICSDKTGTLTRNEMTVTAVHLPGGRGIEVGGAGYEVSGSLLEDGREISAADPSLRALLEAVVLCNDAQLLAPDEADARWRAVGDPTEAALIALARKGGVDPSELRARCPRQAEIPFDPATKRMLTQHEVEGRPHVFLKGAPEVVLEQCGSAFERGLTVPFDEGARAEARAALEHMGSRALRVLAVAGVPGARIDELSDVAALHGRAMLLGLVGELDPPRPEVRAAVDACRAAGIRVVMVTGDHQATGFAVARELGIARDGDLSVDGRELERMSDAELAQRIDRISVFARVHPAQKLRIVEAFQARREVVAMTGDGVNDAPALVRADVGVAMGITGTEVAKEAAKIVVTDDNFATIVSAVEEGRVVYGNIQKTVLLLFSTSAAEVLVLFLAISLGYPPPFSAVQILWNNLVTEGVITVNLVMEPPEGNEMQRRPISADEPLIPRDALARMGLMILCIAGSTLGWFAARLAAGVPEAQVRTETFTLLAICEWFNVLNCRSEWRSALGARFFRNAWLLGGLLLGNALQIAIVFWRPLGRVFRTEPFGLDVALWLALVGSLVLWAEELRKLVARRRAAAA